METSPRIKIENILLIFMISLTGVSTTIGLFHPLPFAEWAWQRHHNILTILVRPGLLGAFAYFSYQRRPAGVAVVLLSFLTSIYWFPPNKSLSPDLVALINKDGELWFDQWNLSRVALLSITLLCLGGLGYLLWTKSILQALIPLNTVTLVWVVRGAALEIYETDALIALLLLLATANTLCLWLYRKRFPRARTLQKIRKHSEMFPWINKNRTN